MATKKADRVKELFNRLRTSYRDQWQYVNQQGHDFSNDNQLSKAEKKVLEDQGMPSFTINRITPVVEMLFMLIKIKTMGWVKLLYINLIHLMYLLILNQEICYLEMQLI